MDGTTDKGNINNEIFHAHWCDVESTDKKVHTRMSYFGLSRPKEVNAQGLFDCLETSLQWIRISALNADEYKRLLGIGSDGETTFQSHLEWLDLQRVHDVIHILETQGWQKIVNEESDSLTSVEPIQRLGKRFRIPLENAGIEVEKLSDEFNKMVLGYRAVWWRLFHTPNAEEWFNC